jgi:hypothetical protein
MFMKTCMFCYKTVYAIAEQKCVIKAVAQAV